MQKLKEEVVQQEIVASVTDPLKVKGNKSKKDSFFWERYFNSIKGKRSILAKWAKEIKVNSNYTFTVVYKPNGDFDLVKKQVVTKTTNKFTPIIK